MQLEVIFNPTKSGNAQAEFEISFSDPLSPPVSTIIEPVSFCLVRRKPMNLLKTAPSVPIFFLSHKINLSSLSRSLKTLKE